MYFPIGWPKVLKPLGADNQIIRQIVSNRDKILFASLTDDSLTVWFCKPTVPIVFHRRNEESLERLGLNVGVEWKPDSSMLCISTSEGHLILYHVESQSENTAYQQYDPPTASLRRDSAELFVKEFKEVLVWDGHITRMCCISGTEILVCTTRSHLLRYRWDGTQNRDYCLDLGRIPFSINQQVSKAEPISEDNVHVNDIEYSPLIFLETDLGSVPIRTCKARNPKTELSLTSVRFQAVQGIWATGIDDATCARVNHKFRLIAIGRKNFEVLFSLQSNQRHLYLQADDKLYVNLEDNLTKRTKISIIDSSGDGYDNGMDQPNLEYENSANYREFVDDNECRKQWIIVRVQSQVFVLDILDDQLVVFGANALVTIYELSVDNSKS
ncbi:Uncharacterized protein OBRU01_05986 [Operophtera brumata]|uniref:Uncharacterized protein n=1 Tax=Operophtera brumata TaxID=104452 RepID=A0A0L7LM68_OPEBR|nr:Uncharacterized protein OBRU01_05986 [Operophtera brumata]